MGTERQLEREQEKKNWQAEYYKGVPPVTLTRQLQRQFERRAAKQVKKSVAFEETWLKKKGKAL